MSPSTYQQLELNCVRLILASLLFLVTGPRTTYGSVYNTTKLEQIKVIGDMMAFCVRPLGQKPLQLEFQLMVREAITHKIIKAGSSHVEGMEHSKWHMIAISHGVKDGK
ncbi:hypothetical protein SK128_012942, partial [Halocaridina rubra]